MFVIYHKFHTILKKSPMYTKMSVFLDFTKIAVGVQTVEQEIYYLLEKSLPQPVLPLRHF